MEIRKLFRFEGSHIVRNCYSDRCKYSIHGHSYVVEVILKASGLDNAGMVLDFGITKGPVKEILDSFDHCHVFWDKDLAEYKDLCQEFSERWIKLPVSPSAEQLSRVFFVLIDGLLGQADFSNGEAADLSLEAVVVHETVTGYAKCFREDAYNPNMGRIAIGAIEFSHGVKADWSHGLESLLKGETRVSYQTPEQQVNPYA